MSEWHQTRTPMCAAADVGMTARCEKHLDESDPFTLLLCHACQARVLVRAMAEYQRLTAAPPPVDPPQP